MNFIEYIENLAERHVDIRDKVGGHTHFLSSERAKHTSIDSVLHYPAVLVDRGSGFDYGGLLVSTPRFANTCCSLSNMFPIPRITKR